MTLRRSLASLLLAGAALTLMAAAPAPAPDKASDRGIDLAGRDTSVKPGDDFFSFANGTWVKTTEIPADRSSYGSNAILAERIDKQVADLIQAAGKSHPKPGSEAAKVGNYFDAYMDEAGIEAKGAQPLKPTLTKIAAIKDRKALASYLGSTLRADVDVMNNTSLRTDNLFGLWVAADMDHPTVYVPFLLQGGLSLPNREYYAIDRNRHEIGSRPY